jgi:hypothetical protein
MLSFRKRSPIEQAILHIWDCYCNHKLEAIIQVVTADNNGNIDKCPYCSSKNNTDRSYLVTNTTTSLACEITELLFHIAARHPDKLKDTLSDEQQEAIINTVEGVEA